MGAVFAPVPDSEGGLCVQPTIVVSTRAADASKAAMRFMDILFIDIPPYLLIGCSRMTGCSYVSRRADVV